MIKKTNKLKITKIFSFCSIIIYFIYFVLFQAGLIKDYSLFFSGNLNRIGEFNWAGDLLSVIYSFDFIFSEERLLQLRVPEHWIYNNPYTHSPFNNEIQAIWSQPPLNIIFFVGSAHLANIIGINFSVVFIIYILCILIFFYKSFRAVLKKDLYLLFILFSFPFLFLLERGNIFSGIGGIFLYLLIRNFIIKDKLDTLDLLFFIIACSVRPNYLVFGLLFLFKKDLKSSIFKFVTVASSFIGINYIFLRVSSKLYPGYKFDAFLIMLKEHNVSEIRFGLWNSSLHSFIHNLFYSFQDFFEIFLPQQLTSGIEKLIIGEGLNNGILIVYIALLLFAFFKLQKGQIDKISFVVIAACVTTLSTSPYFSYHLIIFIFLFLLINDLEISRNITFLQLALIALILLPKLNSTLPLLNIYTLVNVICLNLLLFISIFSKKRIH